MFLYPWKQNNILFQSAELLMSTAKGTEKGTALSWLIKNIIIIGLKYLDRKIHTKIQLKFSVS